MPTFVARFGMESTAFDDPAETARVLRDLADKVERTSPHLHMVVRLKDSNGKRIGYASVEA